jgi:hypothetical protein
MTNCGAGGAASAGMPVEVRAKWSSEYPTPSMRERSRRAARDPSIEHESATASDADARTWRFIGRQRRTLAQAGQLAPYLSLRRSFTTSSTLRNVDHAAACDRAGRPTFFSCHQGGPGGEPNTSRDGACSSRPGPLAELTAAQTRRLVGVRAVSVSVRSVLSASPWARPPSAARQPAANTASSIVTAALSAM